MEHQKIAKFMPRIGGTLIDFLIVIIITTVIMFAWRFIVGVNGDERNYPKEYSDILWRSRSIVVALTTDFIYTVALQNGKVSATVGQKAVGICILNSDFSKASFGVIVVRYIVSIFSSIFLKLGYLVALFTKEKQTLHDLVAGTIVVESDYVDATQYDFNSLAIEEQGGGDSAGFEEALIPIVGAWIVIGSLIFLIRHYSK